MKFTSSCILGLALVLASAADAAMHKISFHTEKLADGIHWMPREVKVTEGETVEFHLTHEIPGADFHGFKIKELGIEKTVDRGKPLVFEAKITLKPGTYPVTCQYHPQHHAAELMVTAAPKKKKH